MESFEYCFYLFIILIKRTHEQNEQLATLLASSPAKFSQRKKRNGTAKIGPGTLHTARVISARRRSIFCVIIIIIRTYINVEYH